MLENTPQLVLQTIFLWKINQFSGIAVASMIFSIISIMVTIASMIIEKQILNSSGYAIVKFNITGSSVVQKINKCRNRVKTMRNQIAAELGLDHRLIEIMRPRPIKGGLEIIIHIHLNHIQSRDSNYQKEIEQCQQNGRIAEISKNVWKLDGVPIISTISFQVKESKNREKNTVKIAVKSVSTNDNMFEGAISIESVIHNNNYLPPQPHIKHIEMVTREGLNDEIDESDDYSDIVNEINETNNEENIQYREYNEHIIPTVGEMNETRRNDYVYNPNIANDEFVIGN